MDFKIRERDHKYTKFYSQEDKKLALNFAKQVDAELKEFLKAAVLFGSAAKGKRSDKGDIDVLLIIDDAGIIIGQEITQAYRIIVEKIAASISIKFHISTLKLTSFWEKSRNGDPVIINMLRDGIPLIDKGFFAATQALLDQGRIRPSQESIWTYYTRAPLSIANAKKHIMQACVDLYWAGIDAAHAALMSKGILPPSPEHVPDMMQEHLVEKKLLPSKYVIMMKELYDLSKHIEHREIKAVTGAQFDMYVRETQLLIDALRKIVKEEN